MKLSSVTFVACLFTCANAQIGFRKRAGRVRKVDDTTARWNRLRQEDLMSQLESDKASIQEEEDEIDELMFLLRQGTVMSMPPTSVPTMAPVIPVTAAPVATAAPTDTPVTVAPVGAFATAAPTTSPSDTPTDAPTGQTGVPTATPTDFPTQFPTTGGPTPGPTAAPTQSAAPSSSPTTASCQLSPQAREDAIFALLDLNANSQDIRDMTTPQGEATDWILDEARQLCPDDPKILQRWALAVVYFATGGEDWLQCSELDTTCGTQNPFVGQEAFLSSVNECQWAGISCNAQACVTEIEFEENNLVGVIPTELGLLQDLVIWGMERGGLTGTIPSEVGTLTNLIFIDLDFNALTGSLPPQLFALSDLTQLDLNNNDLTGSIDGIGVFTDLVFLQLQNNSFTGTIPASIGAFSEMHTFNLHETDFIGTVPQAVCDLVDAGTLTSLIADCGGATPEIECDCCLDCRTDP